MSDRLQEIFATLSEKCQTEDIFSDSEKYEQERCRLANNDEGKLHEQDGYNCDICKNKGVIFFPQLSGKYYTMALRDCKCMGVRRTLRRAKNSGLGNVLTDYTFDKYETTDEWQRKFKDTARAFCKDDTAHWFYVGGQTGAGKTHICTAICAYYIKAGYNCRYMLWRDDAVRLKAVVSDFDKYRELIDEFKETDVLYIDDFLKTQTKAEVEPTTADINLAFELLNYRLQDKNKVTIISSEYTINRALEFDEATIGRIYQQAGIYKITIDRDIKKNYRLK